jgi:hypothetical protein
MIFISFAIVFSIGDITKKISKYNINSIEKRNQSAIITLNLGMIW